MPIADSNPPMVVGIRQTSNETSTNMRLRRPGINRKRLQRGHRQQEDDGQPSQKDIQRDLIGCLLPLGAFDQRDHPVEKGFARI